MSSASTLVSTFSPNLSQTFSQTFSPGTAYRAEAVARAERDLTASTDRYMRHAAHALALAAVRELRDAVGRVAGAGVILLIGGGHNGGDALLAGAFLAGRLDWAGIVEVDAAVVAEHTARADDPPPGLDDVLAAEAWARARADEIIAAASGGPR